MMGLLNPPTDGNVTQPRVAFSLGGPCSWATPAISEMEIDHYGRMVSCSVRFPPDFPHRTRFDSASAHIFQRKQRGFTMKNKWILGALRDLLPMLAPVIAVTLVVVAGLFGLQAAATVAIGFILFFIVLAVMVMLF